MYRLNQIKLNINHSEKEFKNKISKVANVSVADIDWATLVILHKAIDARDKKNILFVYNVTFDFVGDGVGASAGVGASYTSPKNAKSKLEKYEPIVFNPIVSGLHSSPIREGSHSSPIREGSQSSPIRKGSHSSPVRDNEFARPLVVGFGPAGIFASYILALNGLRPIVVERGKSLDERSKDVDKFFKTMELDEESNVSFGEGGAGAFSDGKLNTNNKDKTGIYKFVLETFVKFGADEKILYENLPHIGTDKLVDVIKNMREEIIRLGGEIHYNTKLIFKYGLAQLAHTRDGLAELAHTRKGLAELAHTRKGLAELARTRKGLAELARTIKKDTPVILAIGNSSRDTFRELIENGFDVKAKAIAVGYRIAHRQSFIDESQYGRDVGLAEFAHTEGLAELARTRDGLAPTLGPATYKLTYDVGNGHSVYSFCMCPGGYIINSSNKKGMLSINGMSYNDRSGKYANSAIVETVKPEDVVGLAELARTEGLAELAHTEGLAEQINTLDHAECSPLQMIEFQERVERAAFELEKGFIPYVTSGGSGICKEEVFKGQAKYCERLKSVYENCGLKFDINKDIEMALKHFNKIIPGFFDVKEEGLAELARTEGLAELARTKELAHTEGLAHAEYVIAGVETRTSSPVKLDRDENYMCNVKNFYPCGEGLGHGGGIMSCAVDGINVAMKIVKKIYCDE